MIATNLALLTGKQEDANTKGSLLGEQPLDSCNTMEFLDLLMTKIREGC